MWFSFASSETSNSNVVPVPLKDSKPVSIIVSTDTANSEEEIEFPIRKRTDLLFAECINERVEEANLIPLTEKKINSNDLEFRVWVGFGKKPLEGFVISRTAGKWQGTYLVSINDTIKRPYNKRLSSPKSGWKNFWKQIADAELLTLPDFSEIKGYRGGLVDGTSYVVEIKTNGVYQTYAYLNPDGQGLQEEKQMLIIADTLYTEFSIESDR